ncbi:MAG: endonuclease dU [Candidatus Thorarchaeota archaeon]
MTEYVDLSLGIEEHPGRSWKSAVRVLGVAESFQKTDTRSIVVGVVMRGDLQIDGFGLCRPEVGGLDSTEQLQFMFNQIDRKDIRAWILGGSIISWFNVVDLHQLCEATGIPVISVTYSESAGISDYLREYFPDDWEIRDHIITKNGSRAKLTLNTGHSVFVNHAGLQPTEALRLLNMFTLEGRVSEPVRVARLIAASIRRNLSIL